MATTAHKNTLATAYGTAATYAALYTTSTTSTAAGTEVTGGSPAYARKSITWSSASGGVITATCVFDVPSGVTIVGAGVCSGSTGSNFLDGGTVTSQAYASQGTYTLSLSYTQS